MRRSYSRSAFSAVRTEGGLLPAELLERFAAGDNDVPGLAPKDYHLGPQERLGEAVNRSWSRLLGAWASFRDVLEKAPEGDPATRLTRERWLLPLFQELGYDGPPFRWDEARRFLLRCELDAAFFHLYGIERDDVDYIMEMFPIVKRKDVKQHGDYRTKLQILDVYDRMQHAIDTGEPYQTLLDPPPADPRVAHPPREQGKIPDRG